MTLVPISKEPISTRVIDRLLSFVDCAGQYRHALRIALLAFVAITIVGAVLEQGLWTQQEAFQGPFLPAGAKPNIHAVEIGSGIPFLFSLRLEGDESFDRNARPNPRLEFEGREWSLPTKPPVDIIQGASHQDGAYWLGDRRRNLTFALPDGVVNGRQLSLVASYHVTLRRTFYDIGLWGSAILLLLQMTQIVRRRNPPRVAIPTNQLPEGVNSNLLMRALPQFFAVGSVVVAAASLFYWVTIIYGLYVGDALPTATIFSVVPGDVAARIEPRLPLVPMVFAALGTALAWAESLRLIPTESTQASAAWQTRFWAWCGLPVILSLFLFSLSAGGWSGHARPFDQNYLSIAGLVPHSDARAYFTDAYSQAFWSAWDVLGSRRPMAEGFRQFTVFAAGYSYVQTLVLQAGLIAVALFFAARSVVRWSGIWAGIAFVGLIYIQTRSFLSTTLTEPLALIWTLFSIVFLLDGLRLKSLPHALIALAGLTFALATRMGSLFSIPAVVLWIAVSFESQLRARIRVFTLACAVVIAVFMVNGLLAFLYASPAVATGSNFAYTACGLSLGTDWSDCSRLYDPQLRLYSDEKAKAIFLLAKSWENVLHNPAILLSKLLKNSWSYFKDVPRFLFEGYSPGYRVSGAFAQILVLLLLLSLFVANRARRFTAETAFWAILFLSIGMSAAVVLADDGWRVLHVTHALIACLFAMGFAAPNIGGGGVTPLWRWQTGAGVIGVAIALFLAVPLVSHDLAAREFAGHLSLAAVHRDENIVPGGRFITGFVVLPDGAERPLSIPTLHASEFVEIIRRTNLERDFGPFVEDVIGRVPFALVVTGRLDDKNQSNIYVAPPLVLERRDVRAWRFKLRRWLPGEVPWVTLQEAVTAEPLP